MLLGRRSAALLAALAVGLVGGLAWLGTWPPVATVESDSMRPTLGVGDLLLLRSAENVAVGDVVVVPVPAQLQAERGYPERLAHRVTAIEDGRVTTKGDRRPAPDPFTIPVEAVGQRVVSSVPLAGHALAFVRSPVGMIWLMGGLVLLAVRQRQADESAPATVADLEALREDLVELLGAPPEEVPAEAGAGAPAIAAAGTAAAEPAARSEAADPVVEEEPQPADVVVDSGWPVPVRPSPRRRAAVQASKVGTATRRSLAELARTQQSAPDTDEAPDTEENEKSERSA